MSYMEVKFDKVKLRHFRDCIKSKIVNQYRRWTQAFLFDRLMVTTYAILIDEIKHVFILKSDTLECADVNRIFQCT